MAAPLAGSSIASWNELERAIDRWASLGALAFALLVAVVFLVLTV